MLDAAAARAGLDRGGWWRREDGDGEVAALPPGVDLLAAVRGFVTELDLQLTDHNEDHSADTRIRLRVAMHIDSLTEGALGFAGPALIVLSRLLDSAPVRTALDQHPEANLAQIISASLYERAVVPELGGLRPSQFNEVLVDLPAKNFRERAYVYVPQSAAPARISGAVVLVAFGLVAVLLVLAVVLIVKDRSSGPAAAPPRSLPAPNLVASEQLAAGEAVWSADGHCRLRVTSTGLLDLSQDGKRLWTPGSRGDHPHAYAVMQSDGNFVVYSDARFPRKPLLWASNTNKNNGAYLVVRRVAGECRFVIVRKDGEPLLSRP